MEETELFDTELENEETELSDTELENEENKFAYGYIIEVLTTGLYPNKFDVIREYIQNGYDAICEYNTSYGSTEDLNIQLKIEGKSIFIYDNGIGMNREAIINCRKIGFRGKKCPKMQVFEVSES